MDNPELDNLIASMPGTKILTPLQLNDMRFSGKKTVLTETRLRAIRKNNK